MKVLLVTIGSYGDVHPFAGLGLTLKQRGHEPILFASGNFEHIATAAKIKFVPLGTAEEYRQAAQNPDLWHPTRGTKVVMDMVMESMRDLYQLIVDHYEPGNTVLAMSSLVLGARVAQEKHNIPAASIHLQPAIFRTAHDVPHLPGLPRLGWPPLYRALFWLIDRALIDPLIAPKLNTFRTELGLPPVSGIMKDYWHSPDRVIGFFPDWYAPPQPDWPPQARLVGFPLFDEKGMTPLPAELDAFLAADEKPIVFTPGSAMFHGQEFFDEAAKACQTLGRRGVLLTRHPEQIPNNLPPTVRHFDYAPFSQLLPRVAALVHHGGIGTTAQAMAAACPQLIMPMSHDQFDNAHRVEKLGIGLSLARSKFRGRALQSKLNGVLTHPYRQKNCRIVAEKFIGMDALTDAAKLIEQLGDATASRKSLATSPK